MRILLTGRSGQIGSQLLRTLAPFGDVLATSRQELDLAAPGSILPALERLKPDLIVNAAAFTAVDLAQSESLVAQRVNADAPGELGRWAAARDIPIVHYSSDYVFNGTGHRPWTEESPTEPINVYGATKLAGEIQVIAAGAPALIIRTSWIYATQGHNFLHAILRLSSERDVLRVVDDQVGAPTSADVVARTTAQIIAQGKGELAGFLRKQGGLLHVACAGETSWHGFAQAIIASALRRGRPIRTTSIMPITSREFGAPAPRPANSRLDLARLRQRFGVTPPHWQDELERMLDMLPVDT